MAKSKYTQSDEKYAKWFKEGRGQGTFENYLAWLTIFDVASHGRSHRIPSFKLNRIVTCFSDIEAARVYQLEHDPLVIDYHEQYPLDREKTLEIASRPEVNFAHPNDKGFNIVMTTDFVVRYADKTVAEQVKPLSELKKDRVIEKLKIEGTYWDDQDIEYLTKTEKDFPLSLKKNLQWLHQPLWYKTSDSILMAFASEFMALFFRVAYFYLCRFHQYICLFSTSES